MIDQSKICLITPDRGDRELFLKHCIKQMGRQTVKNLQHIIVGHKGTEGVVDIVPRIKKGIEIARSYGFTHCLIIENDDYYPETYVETMMKAMEQADMVGIGTTYYYSLQSKEYRIMAHIGRSSLFCTGFRIGALDNFVWPSDDTLYFDKELWKHSCSKITLSPSSVPAMPVGMKHGVGFCPGNFHNGISNGHENRKMVSDNDLSWLASHVDEKNI